MGSKNKLDREKQLKGEGRENTTSLPADWHKSIALVGVRCVDQILYTFQLITIRGLWPSYHTAPTLGWG